MPTIRDRGKPGKGRFQVQVRMAGFPARTASFPTKRLAERWAVTIEAEMVEGKHFRNVEARRRTLGEAIDKYLETELAKKRTPAKAMHGFTLPWWKARAGSIKMADITAPLIVDLRDKLAREPYRRAKANAKRPTIKTGQAAPEYKRTPSTVDRYLECLGHVLTVARKEWHWISHNPMDGVSKLSKRKGRVRYLNTDERDALLRETRKDVRLHLLVVLALSTAARAGELVRHLLWRDVDLSEGRLLFRETKNAEPRPVWLHGEALRLLKDHAKVRRIDNDHVFPGASGVGIYDYSDPFKAACKAAGLVDFRFHDLRHTAATYLAMEGATEAQLRAIGGWKSGVVKQYVHIASSDAKDVMARMNKKHLGGADGE